MKKNLSLFIFTILCFGYAFLYIPIISIIIFSFNDSRLVTVWTQFSTKWYRILFENEAILRAMGVSLQVAFISASCAVFVGTLAAIAIIRFKKLKERSVFNGLITAPLVMPDIIMGLALLLLFVTTQDLIGWPKNRGLLTISIAHITLSVSYVVVIVRECLLSFDSSLEEAALDLGARPATVFFRVTLPLIFPSLMAGWLLAFTLSLDDVVIASFTSGAGTTTLPMIVYSSIRIGVTPEINALATLIIGLVTIGVIIAGMTMRRNQRM